MQPTPNVLGAPANGLLGRWGGSKYNQLNPTALSGMTAWYDANERNTLFVDASGRTSVVSNRAEDGGDRFLYLNGASGTYASAPDSAALSVANLDIQALVALDDWTPATLATIVSKRLATGNQCSYALSVSATTGTLRLDHSLDGTTANEVTTVSSEIPSVSDFSRLWIRATRSGSTGAIRFYTGGSGDSPVWVQLGIDRTSTAGNLFDSTAALNIGGWNNGTTQVPYCRVFRAIVRNGYDGAGSTVFDANFSTHTTGSAPLTESANGAVVSFLGNARVTYVGPTNCLCLPGVVSNFASAPDSAALSITGSIDLRADVAFDSWTPATNQMVISKLVTSGQFSYDFFVTATTGVFTFRYSPDGTTVRTANSSVGSGLAAFSRRWVRATYNSATGDVQFFTSTDGTTWVQLGTTVSLTFGSIFDGNTGVGVGANTSGSNFATGRIYRAQIYNGIGGTLAFDANFTTAPKLANSFTESSANAATVTINSTGDLGARIAGEKDLVQLTTTKQPIYLPWSGTNYGWLPGTSGSYFSTPDSAATSITGDFALFGRIAMASWTGAGERNLFGKWLSTGNQRSYALTITAAGALKLYWSNDGTTINSATATANVSFSAFQTGWVYATIDVNDGSGNRVIKFYTAADNGTNTEPAWVQLGSTVTTVGTTSVFDSTALVQIGGTDNGTSGLWQGSTLYAAVRNGYDGAGSVVADFNPTLYTSGTAVLDGSVSTQSLVLDGSSGCYASAPDSAALDITGDIDLRWYGAASNWTPAADNTLIAKYGAAGNRTLSLFIAATTGRVWLAWSADGTTILTATSTASPTVSNFASIWIRATLDVDNGAGGNTVTFFTSADGVTWSQLGTAVTAVGTTSLFNSTAVIEVGSTGAGTGSRFIGRVFRAQVLNGINGTIAFDANFAVTPSLTATSFTESSSNAATVTLNGTATIGPKWTLNGGATIVNRTSLYFDGSDDFMKAPAFALSQPETVYFVGQQVSWTNGDHLFDGGTAATMILYQDTSTPQVRLFAGSSSTLNSGFAVGTTAIASCVFNGASSSLRINRAASTGGNPGTASANGFTLGAQGGPGAICNIRANEVAIYAAAQDASTQDRWALYAGKKWGFNI